VSRYHALFSVGGFAGSMLMTVLLSSRLVALASTLCCAAIMLVATLVAWPRMMTGTQDEKGPLSLFMMPRGIVVPIAGLAAAAFLVEGTLLDCPSGHQQRGDV